MNPRIHALAAVTLAAATTAGAWEDPPPGADARSAQLKEHDNAIRAIIASGKPAPKADAKAFEFPPLATIPKLNDAGYKAMTTTHGSDVLVVNFWATWCGPCVEELPHFIEVSKQNPPERVRFVGLSLDMDNQVDTKVIPFLKEKAIPYPNFLLDPEDADTFITSVSEEWSGAIPATMFYDRAGRKIGQLLEPVTQAELEEALKAALAKAAPAGQESASMSTTVTTHAGPDGTVTTTVTTSKSESDGTTSSSTSTSVQKAP